MNRAASYIIIVFVLFSCTSENNKNEESIIENDELRDVNLHSEVEEEDSSTCILLRNRSYEDWYHDLYGGLNFECRACDSDSTGLYNYIVSSDNHTFCSRLITHQKDKDTIAFDVVQGLSLREKCDGLGGKGPYNYYPRIVDLFIVSPKVKFKCNNPDEFIMVGGRIDQALALLGEPSEEDEGQVTYRIVDGNVIRSLLIEYTDGKITSLRFMITAQNDS